MSAFKHSGEGNGNLLQYSCLKNHMESGGWLATVHRVARVGHDLATKPPNNHHYLHKFEMPMLLHHRHTKLGKFLKLLFCSTDRSIWSCANTHLCNYTGFLMCFNMFVVLLWYPERPYFHATESEAGVSYFSDEAWQVMVNPKLRLRTLYSVVFSHTTY